MTLQHIAFFAGYRFSPKLSITDITINPSLADSRMRDGRVPTVEFCRFSGQDSLPKLTGPCGALFFASLQQPSRALDMISLDEIHNSCELAATFRLACRRWQTSAEGGHSGGVRKRLRPQLQEPVVRGE